jgi:pyrophosphatase PpaX
VPGGLRWSIIFAVNQLPAHASDGFAPFHDTHAVLFDLDGTLLDTVELILSSFRHATAAVLGRQLPDEVLVKNVGVPLAVQMREIDEARAEDLLAAYRIHNGEHHDRVVTAFPGVARVLDELALRGLPMGVVTSKSRSVAERGLTITGIRDRFAIVVACEDTERHKPDPDPLAFAADALGVDLRYCVYVGDSPHDVRAGRAAGARAVAVTWGVASAEDLLAEGPDAIIDDLSDLPKMLPQAPARAGA